MTRHTPEGLWLANIPDTVFCTCWQQARDKQELYVLLGLQEPANDRLALLVSQRAVVLRKAGVALKKFPCSVKRTKSIDTKALNELLFGPLSDARAEERYRQKFDANMTSAETEDEETK